MTASEDVKVGGASKGVEGDGGYVRVVVLLWPGLACHVRQVQGVGGPS